VEKVELPLDVYNAFEGIKRSWGSIVSKDEMNLLLLNIVHIAQVGDALTLKKYALNNATKYIQAVANGYKLNAETKLVMQVDHMLNAWLEKEYGEDEEQDRLEFAKEITGFIKGQTLLQK